MQSETGQDRPEDIGLSDHRMTSHRSPQRSHSRTSISNTRRIKSAQNTNKGDNKGETKIKGRSFLGVDKILKLLTLSSQKRLLSPLSVLFRSSSGLAMKLFSASVPEQLGHFHQRFQLVFLIICRQAIAYD